jgi:ATP-dependent Lon protease
MEKKSVHEGESMINNYMIERRNLPLIPIRGIGIFPNTVLHFDIGREKSINALEEAMLEDSDIFLTVQKVADLESPNEGDFYEIGVICKIKQMIKMPGDNIRVLVEGKNRAKIVSITQTDPYFEVVLDEYIYDDSRSCFFKHNIVSCRYGPFCISHTSLQIGHDHHQSNY